MSCEILGCETARHRIAPLPHCRRGRAPIAERWEGEGAGDNTLTRLALMGSPPFSRICGRRVFLGLVGDEQLDCRRIGNRVVRGRAALIRNVEALERV